MLDGWWIEGHIEGLTGWSIGASTLGKGDNRDHSLDAPSLYDKLEHAIVPLFYHDRRSFMDIMAYSIAINGSFFNTQGMVQKYVLNAYFNRWKDVGQSHSHPHGVSRRWLRCFRNIRCDENIKGEILTWANPI